MPRPKLPAVLVVAAMLAVAAFGQATAGEPKTVLLVGQGPDGHPPTTHEYMAGLELLAKLLDGTDGLKVRIAKADEPWSDGPAVLQDVDGVVLFLSEGARWCQAQPRRQEALTRLAAR